MSNGWGTDRLGPVVGCPCEGVGESQSGKRQKGASESEEAGRKKMVPAASDGRVRALDDSVIIQEILASLVMQYEY